MTRLVAKFYEVFMENDPEAPEVAAKKKEVVAKWKMYCNQKQLLPAALTLCEENCDAIIKKYQEQLKFDLSGEVSDKPIEVLK